MINIYLHINQEGRCFVMTNLTRSFFIALSHNTLLNKGAQRWGFRLGAEQFVAGVDIESVLQVVKKLNKRGINATVDHLGEFVTERAKSITAKENILKLIERINEEKLACHLSIKLTQLGLDIDEEFCLNNFREIVNLANEYNIFINIDMEDYLHYEQTLRILDEVRKNYSNIGTVIQTYLYRAEEDMDALKDLRLRLVKGAYKESADISLQSKDDIDANFLKLAKKRLAGGTFTSIATHDHHIIHELKIFAERENIPKTHFEFQMLYGFRTDLQHSLVDEGYLLCTYLPFGDDWYGYFMRRLAERPQNINLIIKDKLYTKDNKIKKAPLAIGAVLTALFTYLLLRKRK